MSAQLSTISQEERICVRYVAGDGTRTFKSSNAILIGRDGACDLRLEDCRIASHHAELYRVGDLWWVRDLDTADGTYLDEECIDVAPIAGRSALRLGADGPRIWIEPCREGLQPARAAA